MKVGAPVRILAAAAVLTLLLVGVVARENFARDQGQEVRLALAGYDPRSLLQGHYVQFQLREDFPKETPCPPGATDLVGLDREGWIALKRTGDHHAPAGAARTRGEALKLGDVAARGWLDCARGSTLVLGAPDVSSPEVEMVTLHLGVDRIHLDQKSAEALQADLQRAVPGGAPPGYAVLSIGRDGKARVKGVIVGKRRIDLTWF